MIDSGIFNSSSFRDGDQYFLRIDKHLGSDRIYGSMFRTLLNYGGPNVIPQFSTTNHNTQYAIQVNYTHVFSPSTINATAAATISVVKNARTARRNGFVRLTSTCRSRSSATCCAGSSKPDRVHSWTRD